MSNAGAGGNCARPMRLPDLSPVLDKNYAPMGPEILSSTGAGFWRKAPMAFPDSSSGGAPKERQRGRAEKRLSKRVFLESPLLLCPLKVFRTFRVF